MIFLTIKELKERAEKDEKANFKGEVKTVYEGIEAKTKFSNYRQNIMIKDKTDEIKVIYSYKEKSEEYPKDIIGKQIEVSGKVSIYNNQKNIFGRLIFAEGEAPKLNAPTNIKSSMTSITIIPDIEIRKASLEASINFWGAHIGFNESEENIILTAKKFETYIRGMTIKTKIENKPKPEDKPIERKELPKDETKQVIVPEQEKIKLINLVMEAKDVKGMDMDEFKILLKGKDVKDLNIEELNELKKEIEENTEEIPF